jgi:signal transduction histidine kinase/ActR/RegA family two-component response regulator
MVAAGASIQGASPIERSAVWQHHPSTKKTARTAPWQEGVVVTDSAGAQAPREEVQRQLLQLLAEQSRRVPIAVAALLVVVAVIAGRHLPWWLSVPWLLWALAVLMVRRHWLGLLPTQEHLPTEERLRAAVALSFVNGCTHGLALASFPVLQENERYLFSLLMLGLSTGAVGTTAGHRGIFLAYMLPSAGLLPAWWLANPGAPPPGWIELSLALLIALYLWLLVGLADNAWRNFSDSVQMRFQDRAMAAQLREALAQANHANQAKTRFLAAASHDLRQPLHTIGLLVAALSLRPMAGRDREVVDLLSQVSVALSEQLDQLLDISKLDAGVMEPVKKVVDLGEMLRMHHAEMRAAIEARGLRAVLDVPAGVHCWTDPALLLRVLRNLTENALKFTQRGGIELRLRVDHGTACVSVQDTGRGIPAAEQAMVFEEFYQVGNPERDRAKGLGLGLSIVRRLCGLLDIALDLQSTEGRGTCVTLRIPLQLPAPAEPEPPPQAAAHSLAGLTVLVIDDERPVRQGMRMLLEELGCRFVEACSVDEATRQARLQRPDLVLADMRLRNGDTGIAAISGVVAAVGPTPGLLITGDTAPDRLQEAARAGIRLLHKPVALATLQAELAGLLQDKAAA